MQVDEVHVVPMSDIAVPDNDGHFARDQPSRERRVTRRVPLRDCSQPVVLLGVLGRPPYKLIAGRRWYRTNESHNRKTIRATFVGDVDNENAELLGLVQAFQTSELTHVERSAAISKLYDAFDGDASRLQRATGMPMRTIRAYLPVDAMASPELKSMLDKKTVTRIELKRALRAAAGDCEKAKTILELVSESPLTIHQMRRIVQYGETHPRASAHRIINEATCPRLEQSIFVSLTENVRRGMERATTTLDEDASEIVGRILEEWLEEQGFMDA